MENLVPREVYGIGIYNRGYSNRLGLGTGTFFGLGMGIACFFLTPSVLGFGWWALLRIGRAAISFALYLET
jgi:hypothetical protein